MAKEVKKGSKAPKKTSVLRRQKPKQNPKKRRQVLVRKAFYSLMLLAVMASTGAFIYGGQRVVNFVSNWILQPTKWQISLKLEGERPLDDKTAASIMETAQKSLGSGSPEDLQRTAQLVQKQTAFATVHFLKVAPDHIVLSLKQRFPVMCVDADRLRFIATDGTPKSYVTSVVYGEVEDAALCKGPVLIGAFAHGKKFVFHEDSTIVLAPEESEAIQEAVQLLEEAAAANYEIKTLEYRNFRGFFAVMKGSDVEVALGRAPFSEKLEKLGELIGKLSEKGEVASRIELDYQGKAFIKLKKM